MDLVDYDNTQEEDINENEFNIGADKYLESTLSIMNYVNTFGVVILKNGMAIKILNYFEYFREMWNEYKLIKASGDNKELFDFLNNQTNGGVISNQSVDIDLSQIVSTISEHKIIADRKRRKRRRIEEN